MPHIGEMWSPAVEVPLPMAAVAPSGSPFIWTASKLGTLVISGGSVNQLEIGRRGTWVVAGLIAGLIPVSAGDQVRMVYVVAPTVTFIGK